MAVSNCATVENENLIVIDGAAAKCLTVRNDAAIHIKVATVVDCSATAVVFLNIAAAFGGYRDFLGENLVILKCAAVHINCTVSNKNCRTAGPFNCLNACKLFTLKYPAVTELKVVDYFKSVIDIYFRAIRHKQSASHNLYGEVISVAVDSKCSLAAAEVKVYLAVIKNGCYSVFILTHDKDISVIRGSAGNRHVLIGINVCIVCDKDRLVYGNIRRDYNIADACVGSVNELLQGVCVVDIPNGIYLGVLVNRSAFREYVTVAVLPADKGVALDGRSFECVFTVGADTHYGIVADAVINRDKVYRLSSQTYRYGGYRIAVFVGNYTIYPSAADGVCHLNGISIVCKFACKFECVLIYILVIPAVFQLCARCNNAYRNHLSCLAVYRGGLALNFDRFAHRKCGGSGFYLVAEFIGN